MAIREVIEISGSSHKNPIPTAVKVNNMVFTSAVMGTHPETGKIPETIEEETDLLFNYLEEIVEKAGGSTENIAHLSVLITDESYKKQLNTAWLTMFPDPSNRPARHTSVQSLKPGVHIQIEMTAVL